VAGQEFDPALFQENDRTAPAADSRKIAAVGPLDCEAGGHIEDVEVAYETWGQLNSDASNAIVICHALSGDSHAIGWWDRIVGPGKAIDTDQYFVIGTNALGGCQGTSGPGTLDASGQRLGSRFPLVTMGDMVEVQKRLVSQLGIDRLHAVAGGSMGGMQALEWTKRGSVAKCWMTASCRAHSAMQIGINEAGRQAILREPQWCGGDFAVGEGPADGLSVARMIGHISYLSEASFGNKFGRGLQDKDAFDYNLGIEFQVESYLSYQGDKFTKRFDAGSYMVLTRAIDYYDCADLAGSDSEYLFTSFTSDWLYPTHQSVELEQMAVDAGRRVLRAEIDLPFGHDSFLLDGDLQAGIASDFLGA
jgi:homoserine O-acetyltransferase